MPSDVTPPYTATVLRRYDDFLALEPEWRELFAAAERPVTYLRHRWLRLSWEMVWRRPLNRLRIILIRDAAGTLVMAGAFVIYLYRLVPTVEFLGAAMPQTDDLLWRASPDTTAQARLLLDRLVRNAGLAPMLRVLRMRDDSPFHAALRESGLRRNVRETMAAPYLRLTDYPDYAAYFETLSDNLRPDHRRRMRRLGEMPGFAYTHDTGEAAREAMLWSFETKREWLAQQHRTAGWLSSGHVDRFMLAFFAGDDDVPETWVATYRLGSRIIANSICFVESGRVNFFKIAHDPAWGKHSPGRTLSLNEIEFAYSRGMSEFDLGQGTVEWKRRLAHSERLSTSERIWLK